MLFIVGEAGLGKSSLLEYAFEKFGSYSRIHLPITESHGSAPFGTANDLLRALNAGDFQDAQNSTIKERSNKLVEQLSKWTDLPLLIAIDDMHWSDTDSLDALNPLLTQSLSTQFVFIFAMRPWPTQGLIWASWKSPAFNALSKSLAVPNGALPWDSVMGR